MVSVVVADDHPMMLDAVAGLFAGAGFEVTARCHDGAQAREAIVDKQPGLAVLDINMPRLSGLDVLREVRAQKWPTRVILLTASVEPEPIVEAIRLKVDGLVLKGAGADLLLRCAMQVCEGQQWIDREAMQQAIGLLTEGDSEADVSLTPRELDVVRQVAIGRRNKEIARDLGISEGTVKMHLHNLYEKLGVGSRTELAILARDRRIG
jgi:DNA-binding NarL/FixJ family response regulator